MQGMWLLLRAALALKQLQKLVCKVLTADIESPRGMCMCQACLETADDLQSELNWKFLFAAF